MFGGDLDDSQTRIIAAARALMDTLGAELGQLQASFEIPNPTAGGSMRSLRDQFIVGATGSYPVATIAQCDASLVRAHRLLRTANVVRRPRILGDIDRLLDRRTELDGGR